MSRLLFAVPFLVACGFNVGGSPATGDDEPTPPPGDAGLDTPIPDTPEGRWWDNQYARRIRLKVHTGGVAPDKGYAGYTVRATADVATFTGVDPDLRDLRVVIDDGATFTEIPRHVLFASSTSIELRFMLPVDLGDNTDYFDAYLYYGTTSLVPPLADNGTQVYLWYDAGGTSRLADYSRGRMDPWLGTGHTPSANFLLDRYTYNTGNDAQESYRRDVDERDVLVEAQWFHTNCYLENMQSGVCARGRIEAGTGATETASHYYCTTRAQNPMCGNADQAIYDGDIVANDNETIALQGLDDPPPIVTGEWRAQSLAVFGAGPTNLRFWDADAQWASVGYPLDADLQATGNPAGPQTYEMRGFAGVMIAQDVGAFRNMLIRRYTEPEPIVTLGTEETR